METNTKAIQRNARLAKMRTQLSANPLFTKTSCSLQIKIQQIKTRRGSTAFTNRQFKLSKDFDIDQIQDLQMDAKFHSLFKDKYELINKIGEGSNGVVRRCRQKETQIIYAVKTFKLDQEHFLYLKKNFRDIKDLKHEHIISYKALFFEKQNQTCHLVMEYQPYPNLLHLKYKSEQFLKEIIYQILKTLAFLHKNKICHRDIKPENILYDQLNKKIKIIDFGISKHLMQRGRKKEMLTITGTLYYRAPQMFDGGGYDQMVDIWALGVTMYKLMTGRTPFESEYHNQTIQNIKGGIIAENEALNNYTKTPRNLISRFLKNRKERLTAELALKDSWFVDIVNQQEQKQQQIQSMIIFSQKKKFSYIKDLEGGKSNLTFIEPRYLIDKSKKEINYKEFKSLREIMNIQEEQSMIYGCDEIKQNNLRQI